MTYSITYPGGSLPTPASIVHPSHDQTATSGTIVHELMSGAIAYTLRQGTTSKGKLTLSYTTQAAAKTAYSQLLLATVYTYTNDAPSFTVKFVVAGDIELTQPTAGGNVWTLAIPIREVS